MFVVVVDNPKLGIREDNLITYTGQRCKHLKGDKPGEYSCNIHHYKWFKKTPCSQFNQVERTNSPCRLGTYFIKLAVCTRRTS